MNAEEFLAKWQDNEAVQQLLDDLVIDAYTDMACNLNNQGMLDQLEFLLTEGRDLEELDAMISGDD